MLVESVDAAPQQVAAVQVVGSRPLEEFATRLLEHEIVVRGETDVARLADVADPGVLLSGSDGRCRRCRRSRRYPR